MARSILKETDTVRPWIHAPVASPTPWVPQPAGCEILPEGAPGPGGCSTVGPSSADDRKTRETPLEHARVKADAILKEAEAEAERLHEAASREGYEAGRATAQAELAAERQRLGELVAGIDTAYRQFCADQAPALAELAVAATGRLLREQLQLDPSRVLAVVNQALENVVASNHIVLHLHPDDEERVRSYLATRDARQTGGVEIMADESVERGGCWPETEHGEIDATVSGRLDRLARALDDVG